MRKYRNLAAIGVAILAVPCAWEATASAVLCWGIGRLDLYQFPYTQWLETAPWWRVNWWLTFWVVLSAIIATLIWAPITFGGARFLVRRRVQQSLYGKTGWAESTDIQRGGLQLRRRL
ncbi:MAG: hypothetical protein ABSC06_25000 [Rhodopila sp.]